MSCYQIKLQALFYKPKILLSQLKKIFYVKIFTIKSACTIMQSNEHSKLYSHLGTIFFIKHFIWKIKY